MQNTFTFLAAVMFFFFETYAIIAHTQSCGWLLQFSSKDPTYFLSDLYKACTTHIQAYIQD